MTTPARGWAWAILAAGLLATAVVPGTGAWQTYTDVTVDIPVGLFVCITGVSGSGKSTLINDTLYNAVAHHLYGSAAEPAEHEAIEGLDLNELLAGMAKMLHRLVGEDVQLVEVPAPELGHVLADPGLPTGEVSLVEVPALAISSTVWPKRMPWMVLRASIARTAAGPPAWRHA